MEYIKYEQTIKPPNERGVKRQIDYIFIDKHTEK